MVLPGQPGGRAMRMCAPDGVASSRTTDVEYASVLAENHRYFRITIPVGVMSMHRILGTIALLSVVTMGSRSAAAQRSQTALREMARRVPVLVALTPGVGPDGSAAVIWRRPDVTPHDVIMLNSTYASAEQLEAAVIYLSALREQSGGTASVAAKYRVPQRGMLSRAPRASARQAAAVVARLQTDTLRTVPGLGRVRAREIYLHPRSVSRLLK